MIGPVETRHNDQSCQKAGEYYAKQRAAAPKGSQKPCLNVLVSKTPSTYNGQSTYDAQLLQCHELEGLIVEGPELRASVLLLLESRLQCPGPVPALALHVLHLPLQRAAVRLQVVVPGGGSEATRHCEDHPGTMHESMHLCRVQASHSILSDPTFSVLRCAGGTPGSARALQCCIQCGPYGAQPISQIRHIRLCNFQISFELISDATSVSQKHSGRWLPVKRPAFLT